MKSQLAILLSAALLVGLAGTLARAQPTQAADKTAEQAAESALQVGDQAVDGQLVDSAGNIVPAERLLERGARGGALVSRRLVSHLHATAHWHEGGDTSSHCSGSQASSHYSRVARIRQADRDQAAGGVFGSQRPGQYPWPTSMVLPTSSTRERQPGYQQRFGLSEVNGDGSMVLPLPVAYVINEEGIITFAFVNADYRQRAKPQDIATALAPAEVQ